MKNKIKIFIILGLLILIGIAVAIPKSAYQKWFEKPKTADPIEEVYTEQVFVKNSSGKLVGLDVKVDKESTDKIVKKWELLTTLSDSIPSGYQSVVNTETVLIDYQVNGGILQLNVTEKIKESEGRLCAEALAWTFTNDEIKEVQLFVDDVKVDKIADYQINKITREIGTNFIYETKYLFECNATTIVYYEESYVLPVTYFHLEKDTCNYIIDKTCDISETSNIEYELLEDALVINFLNNEVISERDLKSLTTSLIENYSVSKLTINNQEKNLYEAVIGVVDTENPQ